MLDLESTENQVTVTEAALTWRERELSLAQDRFRNGVTDNIEVVTAQASLASAQDDRIMALAQHADAGMALVRSLGGTEKIYQTYLGEPVTDWQTAVAVGSDLIVEFFGSYT